MLTEKREPISSSAAILACLLTAKISSGGRSESEVTELAVMACTWSPCWAATTVTPVANSPMASRKARGSTACRPAGASGAAMIGLGHWAGTALIGLHHVAPDELAHHIHVGLAVVPLEHGPGHAHRVAEEEALIQHLARAEGRYGGVPGQAEKRNAVQGLQPGRLVIVLDVGAQRAVDVGPG